MAKTSRMNWQESHATLDIRGIKVPLNVALLEYF